MIIRKLILNNFGVYAGRNEFVFSGKKPIVLIGGLNGRGKTTFLEGVLLSLYGSSSFAYKESAYSTYGKYLKSYVNALDETLLSFVEIEFDLTGNNSEVYTVHREWNGKGQRTSEFISVKKNGVEDSFLAQNWMMFVENILPSALSNFFFFDGEKIAELAVDNTSAQIKESIRAMLGISTLDVLKNDLHRNGNKLRKNVTGNDQIARLREVENRKRILEEKLKGHDEQIEEKQIAIKKVEDDIEQLQIEHTTKGGEAASRRDELLTRRSSILAQIDVCNDMLLNISTGDLPLTLVRDLLDTIKTESVEKNEQAMEMLAIEKLDESFKKYRDLIEDADAVKKFISILKKNQRKAETTVGYGLPEHATYRLIDLVETGLNVEQKELNQLLKRLSGLQEELKQVEEHLSVDINESLVDDILSKIKKRESDRFELEVELNTLKQLRSSLNGETIRATAEYNKLVEATLESLEAKDDINRTIKYSQIAENIIDEFSKRLQKEKVNELAATITACYKKLANKKNLIDRIQMDPDSLEINYYNKSGEEVQKLSLSAGEKQLMVISILWALVICSNKKLPVIIDTPLSRMDSNHRAALIQVYFPQASEQTIILSTDSEIDEKYYAMMRRNIGDEFTLVYDEETKSTTVKQGYFVGERI